MSSEDHSSAYLKVLGALLAFTAITVAVSFVNFGTKAGNIVVGVIIAVVKASLVAAIFMHMKYEKRWWLGLLLFPMALVMIIIFSNFADTALNGSGDTKENGEFTTPAAEHIEHGHAGGPAR
jgi:cytochrome c oxidase subunit 4